MKETTPNNKTTNPTYPQLKNICAQIYPPRPPTGATEKFHKSTHIWEKYSFFLQLHKHKFEICLFINYIRATLRKFISCPFSPRQPNTHRCTPPPNQKTYFSRYFSHAHPKISKCHQNLSKLRVIFAQTPNQESSRSAISKKSENAQNNILPIST